MTRPLIVIAVVIAVIAIAVFALRSPSPTGVDSAKNTSSPSPMASQASAAGGSAASKAPAALAQAAGADAVRTTEADITKPWTTQPVKADVNPQVKSVADAAQSDQHPERLSPMIAPVAFDQVAWNANPSGYLAVTEPGRVFQTAQPSPTTPILVAEGPTAATVARGESTSLRVKAVPGAAVSWTSFDLGSFDNKLPSITVAADRDGVASVTFTATPGVSGQVNILAGSPMASGQVRFTLTVPGHPITPLPVAAAGVPAATAAP